MFDSLQLQLISIAGSCVFITLSAVFNVYVLYLQNRNDELFNLYSE